MSELTIVDIYYRVSTDDQEDNTSLDEQEACGREYCRENGLIVGEVWKETYSGYVYRERVKLGKMRRRYQEGKYRALFFARLIDSQENRSMSLFCLKRWSTMTLRSIV